MGVLLVVLGCLLLAADGTRWDVVLVALPSGGPGGGKHGLEASEVAGFALALAGVMALWSADASQRRHLSSVRPLRTIA